MTDRKAFLREAIAKLPRVKLANLPTPLEEASRLSKMLGGPRIFFKRDDLTGLPQSGNKTRMFEFSLAEAVKQQPDIVLASANTQSNYCRQLATSCAKLGLKVHLVLRSLYGEKDHLPQGNLLLDLLAGATVKIVKADITEREDVKREELKHLRKEGYENIFLLRRTDYDMALEAIGYVSASLELANQLDERGIRADYVYTPSVCTTQAGLLVGNKILEQGWKIVGIDPTARQIEIVETMARIASKAATILGFDVGIHADEITSYSEFSGGCYGFMTNAGREAIKLVAGTEGIFLDPVYSGKAMSALISDIEKGKIKKDETVVFIHTGGFPTLFSFNDEFQLEDHLIIHDQVKFLD